MDSKKWLKTFWIAFQLVGWAILLNLVVEAIGVYRNEISMAEMGITTHREAIYLPAKLPYLFSMIGNAFFAFLVGSVFRMLELGRPVQIELAGRLLLVCCFGYGAEAVVRSYFWIIQCQSLWHVMSFSPALYFAQCLTSFVGILVPLLYAAAVFVLFKHFSKMLAFEAEVA